MRYSWKFFVCHTSLILDRSKRNGEKDRSCMYSEALRQPAQRINRHWVSSSSIYGVHKYTMDRHEPLYRKKIYAWELHIEPLHLKMSKPCPYMLWTGNTNLMNVVMLIVIASQSCSFDGQTRHWSLPTQRLDSSVQSVIYCQRHSRKTVKEEDVHRR